MVTQILIQLLCHQLKINRDAQSGQLLNGVYSQTLLLYIILSRVLVYLGTSLLHNALLAPIVSASMTFCFRAT